MKLFNQLQLHNLDHLMSSLNNITRISCTKLGNPLLNKSTIELLEEHIKFYLKQCKTLT